MEEDKKPEDIPETKPSFSKRAFNSLKPKLPGLCAVCEIPCYGIRQYTNGNAYDAMFCKICKTFFMSKMRVDSANYCKKFEICSTVRISRTLDTSLKEICGYCRLKGIYVNGFRPQYRSFQRLGQYTQKIHEYSSELMERTFFCERSIFPVFSETITIENINQLRSELEFIIEHMTEFSRAFEYLAEFSMSDRHDMIKKNSLKFVLITFAYTRIENLKYRYKFQYPEGFQKIINKLRKDEVGPIESRLLKLIIFLGSNKTNIENKKLYEELVEDARRMLKLYVDHHQKGAKQNPPVIVRYENQLDLIQLCAQEAIGMILPLLATVTTSATVTTTTTATTTTTTTSSATATATSSATATATDISTTNTDI